MADQKIYDKRNNLIGTIHTLPSGVLQILDRMNNVKGTYDPKTNVTRDRNNNLVATGNVLGTLI